VKFLALLLVLGGLVGCTRASDSEWVVPVDDAVRLAREFAVLEVAPIDVAIVCGRPIGSDATRSSPAILKARLTSDGMESARSVLSRTGQAGSSDGWSVFNLPGLDSQSSAATEESYATFKIKSNKLEVFTGGTCAKRD
jgi:hypothetical protein